MVSILWILDRVEHVGPFQLHFSRCLVVRFHYERIHFNVVEAVRLPLGPLPHLLRRWLNRVSIHCHSFFLLRRLHGLVGTSDLNLLVPNRIVGRYLKATRVGKDVARDRPCPTFGYTDPILSLWGRLKRLFE